MPEPGLKIRQPRSKWNMVILLRSEFSIPWIGQQLTGEHLGPRTAASPEVGFFRRDVCVDLKGKDDRADRTWAIGCSGIVRPEMGPVRP
jgi:hypothetical protein